MGPDTGPAVCPLTRTNDGPVQGNASGAACAYEGIPYAAPPVGDLRWKAPAPRAAWTTPPPSVLGPWCPQLPVTGPWAAFGVSTPALDEDCLYLNVWAPAPRPTSPAPVMVFIHGGSSEYGSGGQSLYDGTNLATATGNLVVTINYRLGALGFLSNPELRAEDTAHGLAGAYGIMDQIAALQWVHDNIAAFGGDPADVTIFGESAGAGSMVIQLASPPSRGLFSRVIIESYGVDGPNYSPGMPQANGDIGGANLARALGCTQPATLLSCLRAASVSAILNVGSGYRPVIDGYVMPVDPIQAIKSGSFTKVPTVLGNNRNEGTLFVNWPPPSDQASYQAYEESQFPGHGLAIVTEYPIASYGGSYFAATSAAFTDAWFVCPTRVVARAVVATGTPTFRYDFAHALVANTPVDAGAFHTAELPFIFDNPYCFFPPCVDSVAERVSRCRRRCRGTGARWRATGTPTAGGASPGPPTTRRRNRRSCSTSCNRRRQSSRRRSATSGTASRCTARRTPGRTAGSTRPLRSASS